MATINDTHFCALEGLRVLEIASPLTSYCGKMFADMGADLVLIEPPGGCHMRREGPFVGSEPGLENSLTFAYHNTSKRGITLDLNREEGRTIFRRLAETADLILEGERPSIMDAHGLGWSDLCSRNRKLVITSITPFGQTGPYSQYTSEDIVALAMGGLLYLGGYPDTAPNRVFGNQAFLCAAMYGAVAAMLGLTHAELTGKGQHIDVSMQECVVMAMETAVQSFDLEGEIRKRDAGKQRFAGTGVFQCKDGYIYMMAGGIGANKFWPNSLQWLIDEGVPGVERLAGAEWNDIEYLRSEKAKRIFSEVFAPWARQHNKSTLYHEGQRRHIPLAPINSVSDIVSSKQLEHRKYFVKVSHPGSTSPLVMPGAPYQFSVTPWRIGNRAPTLGEHTAEVLGSLGITNDELAQLAGAGVL